MKTMKTATTIALGTRSQRGSPGSGVLNSAQVGRAGHEPARNEEDAGHHSMECVVVHRKDPDQRAGNAGCHAYRQEDAAVSAGQACRQQDHEQPEAHSTDNQAQVERRGVAGYGDLAELRDEVIERRVALATKTAIRRRRDEHPGEDERDRAKPENAQTARTQRDRDGARGALHR